MTEFVILIMGSVFGFLFCFLLWTMEPGVRGSKFLDNSTQPPEIKLRIKSVYDTKGRCWYVLEQKEWWHAGYPPLWLWMPKATYRTLKEAERVMNKMSSSGHNKILKEA